MLGWTPGKYAVRQNIYLGGSAAEVEAARIPAIKDLAPTVTSIPLPRTDLVPGKICYWRVESVNGQGLPVVRVTVWETPTSSAAYGGRTI